MTVETDPAGGAGCDPDKPFALPSPSLGKRLLGRLITIRRIRSIMLNNMGFGIRLPLSRKLRAWRHGFAYRDWLLCDLDHHDPTEYLPHHASLDYSALCANYRALNDKLLFARGLTAIGIETPRPIAFVLRGRLRPFTGEVRAGASPGAWLAREAFRRGGLVLKPVIGLAGSGLLFIGASAAGLTANSVAITGSVLDELVAGLDQYLVTEQVAPAAYAAAIFPQATNTLRVLTLWDYLSNRPFVAAAVHRFGSSRSLPVDNFHGGTGGLCANVDLTSGELGAAMTLDGSGKLHDYPCHPETGSAIAGVAVPNWTGVLSAVLRAASAFAESPFVGWDIALAESGPVFIEANVPPSVHVWQVHGGLLRDPRVRAFFESRGMIGPPRPSRRHSKPGKGKLGRSLPDTRARIVARSPKHEARPAAFPGGIPGAAFAGYPLPLSARLSMRLASWRRFAAIHAANRSERVPMAITTRLRAARHGFCARHWLVCDLAHQRLEHYVPDFADLEFGLQNANFRAVNDRILLSRGLSSLGLAQPHPFAFVQQGRIHVFDQGEKPITGQGAWLASEAVRRGAIVLLPVDGAAGRGAMLLQNSPPRLTSDGRCVTPASLDRLLAGLDQVVITEYIAPAAYAAAIWPHSANTLLILTLWDYAENRPVVAAAVHRFGDSRCAATRFFLRGGDGLLARIDLESGALETAVTLDESGTRRCFANHPGTGAAITGTLVPRWPETLAAVLHAASALVEVPLVGWEILVSEQGPVFLGASAPPALWTWQVHGGLLRDPRARRFFEAHRMVPSLRKR